MTNMNNLAIILVLAIFNSNNYYVLYTKFCSRPVLLNQ